MPAMTFEQYWQRLVEKNPSLSKEDTRMVLTVGSFKRSTRKAFEVGMAGTNVGTTNPDWMERIFQAAERRTRSKP